MRETDKKIDGLVTSHHNRWLCTKSKFKARESRGVRRACRTPQRQRDEAQRRNWAFYEAIKIRLPILRGPARWLIAALAIAVAGCTAIQKQQAAQTQQLLAAAGFEMQKADTPERLATLQSVVPQRKVFSVDATDGPRFVYADADYCQCAYAGDQQAYVRYQRMVSKQRLAAEQDMAAQMGDDATMTWGPWSPW